MIDDVSDRDVEFEPEDDTSRLIEGEAELEGEAGAKAKLKKLKDELAVAKKERQEYLDGWQRCKADSVNARKEAMAASERAIDRARDSFIEELLPVLDSFDMAAGSEAWESMDAGWKSGIEHIRNQLLGVLEQNGVKRFGKIGEPFNPAKHEAVQETDEMPGEPHTIVKILRFGYQSGERILRPAQVIVKQ